MRNKWTIISYVLLCLASFVWMGDFRHGLGLSLIVGGVYGLIGLIVCKDRTDKLIGASWVAIAIGIRFVR